MMMLRDSLACLEMLWSLEKIVIHNKIKLSCNKIKLSLAMQSMIIKPLSQKKEKNHV